MDKKSLSTVLGVVLIGGMVVGVGISHAATNTATKVTKANTVAATVTTQSKVKISQDQATQIALKAHKDSKLLDIQLVKRTYLIHLQTTKGKDTMKVGANTGRILADTLESTTPASKSSTPAVKTVTPAKSTSTDTAKSTTTSNDKADTTAKTTTTATTQK